jgi:AcrR family transcriptional regulator
VSVRQLQRAAARERIARAALAQVAEGGYASASIHQVARRAGVAAGSIYTHFPSKGELFAEVFREASDRELALVAAIVEDPSRPAGERLATAVEAFCRRALAAPTLAWALMAEPVDPAVESARLENKRRYRDVFAALLREGVRAHEFGPLDADIAAAALVGALQEALIGPLAPAEAGGRGKDALVAGLVQFCLNAVAHKGPVAHKGQEERDGLDSRRSPRRAGAARHAGAAAASNT